MKKAEIAAARHEAESAGIKFNDVSISTDSESRELLTGAVVQTLIEPSYSLQWKTPAGFITVTADQLKAVATAVRQHVQRCFDKEAELLGHIEAAKNAEELAEIVWK